MDAMGWMAPRLLSSVPLQAVFARRLRRVTDSRLRARLAAIAEAFTAGYHAALEEPEPEGIAARLARVEPEKQGFAAEGIGLGLALLDGLAPASPSSQRDRLTRYLAGPGGRQTYMLHTGAGWALAFPLLSRRALLARLDPVLGAMSLDGYGFYRAFFFRRRTVDRGRPPAWVSGADRRTFDVGVGRRLWFLDASPERILGQAAAFPEDRRVDVWAGLGEACAFGGGRDAAAVAVLRRAASPFLPAFAQGVAFAAEARDRAGIPAAHTELACRAVWERGAAATAEVVRESAVRLPGDGAEALATWRRRIRERFCEENPARSPTRGVAPG
jgi:enediyne biosynthesis protein E3